MCSPYSLTSKIESSLMGVQACFDMIMMIRGLMILVFFDGSAAAILASKRNKLFVLSASTRLSDAASRLRCLTVVKSNLNGILLLAPEGLSSPVKIINTLKNINNIFDVIFFSSNILITKICSNIRKSDWFYHYHYIWKF